MFGCLIPNVNGSVQMEYIIDHGDSLTLVCDRETVKSANVMTVAQPQTGRAARVCRRRDPLFDFASQQMTLSCTFIVSFHSAPSTPEHTHIC